MARRSCCRRDQTAERTRVGQSRLKITAKANDLPTRSTCMATAEAIEMTELPAILKPRVGTGSEGWADPGNR